MRLTKEQKVQFEKAWKEFKIITSEDGIKVSKQDFLDDWLFDPSFREGFNK